MKVRTVALLLMGVILCFCGISRADLVNPSFDLNSEWAGNILVPLEEIFTLNAFEQTTSTFVVTATNKSDFVWTGYMLSLDPAGDATFVEGTAGSTRFKTVDYPDLWTIEFSAPEEVPIGGAVALQFDISLSDSASFSLTQQPIPEPATVVFMGFGALALVIVRKW